MFPRISKSTEKGISKIRVQYLKNSVGLEIDENICQGCGICVKVCPTQAAERGPVGGSKKFLELEDIIPTITDPEKCSYCGLCVFMCPWNAITLFKDDEEVKIEDFLLVKEHALPELDYTMKKCKEGVDDAKSYFEGEIEFKTENCPGGCNTCIEICPTEALHVEKPDTPWDKGRKIVVDEDKCILCGTCTNGCPVFDAIKLTIKEVKFKGEYNPRLWDKVVDQLKISRMRGGKKIN
ncbi:MAG: 4Fe-4S binding protein [Promethearchaeota archaeon]